MVFKQFIPSLAPRPHYRGQEEKQHTFVSQCKAPQYKFPKITGDRTESKVLPRALIDPGSSEKEESLTKLILRAEDAHSKSTISTLLVEHQAPDSPKTYRGLYVGETLLSALVFQLLF